MSAVDILIRAEELLYEERWSPNAIRGIHGPRCAYWAIVDAERIDLDVRARVDAHRAFRTVIGGGCITTWNDAPERTLSEVMDAFEQAIALAKEREAA